MNETINQDKEAAKKWMTVTEMGNLLGLKKTDRYWLVPKNVFETKEIAGKMRVNVKSFENWYANQVKYHKVTGEEPGIELKKWSYSIRDIAQMLSIEESVVYDLLIRENIETVTVDYWKRVPKSVFREWYKSQSRYLTRGDRKAVEELYEATISMPEMARLLGVERHIVYTILISEKYKHFFEMIEIAEQKRITKESFLNFLNGQKKYRLDSSNDHKELNKEKNALLADFRRKKLWQTGERRSNGNRNYLTPDEAAFLAKVSRTTIINWYQMEYFPVVFLGNRVFIKRKEFESFIIPQCHTMQDLLDEYVMLYGKDKWAISTYEGNVGLINNYILPIIGKEKLSDINTRFVEKYYQKLLKMPPVANPTGKRAKQEYVTASTVREIHKLLRSCFEQAIKWELMERNPCIYATVPKHKSKKRDIWTAEKH